jgi:hypothetical protein
VSFLDGATPLGQGTLSGGVATLTTSSLALGSHTVTAIYSGDTNVATSTSGALTESVMDFAVSTPSSGSGSGSAQTVTVGGSATYTLAITPTSGTSIPTQTTLTLTGLPDGTTATVTPAAWVKTSSTTWSLPANTIFAPLAVAIQLPSQTAHVENKNLPSGKFPSALWGVLLLPFACRLRRTGKWLGRMLPVLLLLAASLATAVGLSGCGSGSGFFSQQQKTYTITVTATAGAVSRSTNVMLSVE